MIETRTPTPDRAPDRIAYGPWEPVYGPERVRLVATDWSLFTVRTYTEVRDRPVIGSRRQRSEIWWTPGGIIGRWEWEYEESTCPS